MDNNDSKCIFIGEDAWRSAKLAAIERDTSIRGVVEAALSDMLGKKFNGGFLATDRARRARIKARVANTR